MVSVICFCFNAQIGSACQADGFIVLLHHVYSSGKCDMNSFTVFFRNLSTFTSVFFPALRILSSVCWFARMMSLKASPYVFGIRSSFFYVILYLLVKAGHWSKMWRAVSSHIPHSLQMLVLLRCLVSLSPRSVLDPERSLKICLIASVRLGFKVI